MRGPILVAAIHKHAPAIQAGSTGTGLNRFVQPLRIGPPKWAQYKSANRGAYPQRGPHFDLFSPTISDDIGQSQTVAVYQLERLSAVTHCAHILEPVVSPGKCDQRSLRRNNRANTTITRPKIAEGRNAVFAIPVLSQSTPPNKGTTNEHT